MKYFKTFEGVFDTFNTPRPPAKVVQSLKAINEDYYSVLLNWFEDIFKKDYKNNEIFAEQRLEQYYRDPTSTEFSRKIDNMLFQLKYAFVFLEHWIKLKNYSKAELKSQNFEKFKQNSINEIEKNYNDLGKLSWNPEEEQQHFESLNLIKAKYNSDWKWFGFSGDSELQFIHSVFQAFEPTYPGLDENEKLYILYNVKTLELYVLIYVSINDIRYVQKNDFTFVNDINIDLEINNFIESNMNELFNSIIYDDYDGYRYNVNWKTFYPLFVKYGDSIDNIVVTHLAFKAGAISNLEYNKTLNNHFNDIYIIDNKIYTTINDLSDFARFFEEEKFVEEFLTGTNSNDYDFSDFNWQDYWYLTSNKMKQEMINDINQKFNANIQLNDYNALVLWLDNSDELSNELKHSAANAQYIADEDEINKDIMKQLNDQFNFKWSEKHEAYLLDVTSWINELFEADPDEWPVEYYRDITDFIQYSLDANNSLLQLNEPTYGWHGEVTSEIWNEELASKWSDLF